MDFMQAVKAMLEGMKVRREVWKTSGIRWTGNGFKFGDDSDLSSFDKVDFEATDWQIVEEEKTLSDKVHTQGVEFDRYFEKDVKETFDLIKEDIENKSPIGCRFINVEIINKRAGDRLT